VPATIDDAATLGEIEAAFEQSGVWRSGDGGADRSNRQIEPAFGRVRSSTRPFRSHRRLLTSRSFKMPFAGQGILELYRMRAEQRRRRTSFLGPPAGATRHRLRANLLRPTHQCRPGPRHRDVGRRRPILYPGRLDQTRRMDTPRGTNRD